jgi:ankyrin repeat protein
MTNILELINDNKFDDILKIKDYDKIKINDNNIIHLLAIRGNDKGLDYFIKHKSFDINIGNNNGSNILHLLFQNGWDDLCEKYYKLFPDLLFAYDENIYVPLVYTIERFDVFNKCLQFMKKHSDNNKINDILNEVNLSNTNIISLLIDKTSNNKYTNFLESNYDIIDFDKPKKSPILIYCIENKKDNLAKYFIEKNKGLESKNSLYLLPINIAAGYNNIDIVKLLLDKSQDISYGGLDNDYLPLSVAINNDFLDLVEILIKHVSNFNIIDKYKNTYMHYMTDKLLNYYEKKDLDKEKQMKHIIRKYINKCNIDYPNIDNMTPRKLLKEYLKLKTQKTNKVSNKSDTEKLILSANSNIKQDSKQDTGKIKHHNTHNIDIIKSTKKYNSGLFNADVLHNMIYSIYLLEKYDNIFIPFQKYYEKNYKLDNLKLAMQAINYNNYYIIMYDILSFTTYYLYNLLPSLILWRTKDLYFIHDYLFDIIHKEHKNKDKRFIMIKITLIVGYQFTHANMILIDLKNYSVRRFEPYGLNNVRDERYLDKILEEKISKALGKSVKYYKPADYLDLTRFQSVSNDAVIDYKKTGDPGGYCLAWCFWYIELKLKNPDLEEEELINKAADKISYYYKNTNNPYLYFIRDYARKLNTEKDKILRKIKINKNDFYDLNYKKDNLQKIFNYLNKYF